MGHLPDRELVQRKAGACSKCGTFPKSGRVSCCAPGGSWYKNCGAANNDNFDHKWSEGTEVCKPPETTAAPEPVNEPTYDCPVCGFLKRSGKRSCCGKGGAWFGKCGGAKSKLPHTWFNGIQACKPKLKSAKASKGASSAAAQQQQQDDYYQEFVLGAANITTPAPLTIPRDISNAMSKYDVLSDTTTVASASTTSIATTSAPPTTKPSMEKTEMSTSAPARTKALSSTTTAPPTTTTIPVEITDPVEVTPVSSTDWAENDDFLEQAADGADSVSVFASLQTMFFACFILFG